MLKVLRLLATLLSSSSLQSAPLDPALLVDELEEVLALVVAVDRQEDGQEGGHLVGVLVVVVNCVKCNCS